jgi:hypothetical protein
MSATMRTVCTAKKIDMHTNRATRLRTGINLKMTASATIAKQKTRDRSIEKSCSAPHWDFFRHLDHCDFGAISPRPEYIRQSHCRFQLNRF